MNAVQLVLNWARAEVGVREEGGNNRGPRVAEYLASVGLGVGNPWCAAVVAFCFKKAGVQGWPMTGDTWAIEDWARANGCLHDTPQVGDVFLLLGRDGRPIHTGFVTGVLPSGWVETIEGNTGSGSDTDGDGVFHKRRYARECRFVHWADVLGDGKPAAARVVYAKVFDHDGKRALVLPDGKRLEVVGVKINDVAWAGGDILIGIREED